jgi:hypothetical protein
VSQPQWPAISAAVAPLAANEALVEVTRRIDAGERRPDRANLNLVIELAGIASTTAALR